MAHGFIQMHGEVRLQDQQSFYDFLFANNCPNALEIATEMIQFQNNNGHRDDLKSILKYYNVPEMVIRRLLHDIFG